MGLDMYLTARRSFWDHMNGGESAKQIHKLFPELPEVSVSSGTTVSVQFGYWRKANAIHHWLVQNIQDGKDECQETYFSREDMKKLFDIVSDVLANKNTAPDLLPTANGFFFGGTEYDDWYWEQMEYTDPLMDKWDFYYQASW